MKRLLISLLLLITACSREQDPTQHSMSSPDTILMKEDIQGLVNSNLIPTDNGVIDLTNRTKTEYNGEFKNTRPLDTKLTISHELVDFGLVNGSQVVGYRLSVKNVGVDDALNLKISADENFIVGSDRCTGLNLKTDEVCSFRILFTGKDKAVGEYLGKVSVFAEANNSVVSNLQAQVGESKNITLESLQGLDIEFTDRGTQEVVRNLRIVNRGPGVAERILVKTYSGEFKLLANGCEGASLAKNQYCTLSVSYDPNKNNTGRAVHSKLTVIPQDYSKNSLEINLRTTLSPLLTIKEDIKEQDKSTKDVEKKLDNQPELPKLQAPNLAYNTKQLEKLNKQADKEKKQNQKQVQNAEKLLQSELLKEQEAEAKRQAELKAQELAAQIAAEKQKAAEEANRLKQERLEKEKLAQEESARLKKDLLEKQKLAKEEAAKKALEKKEQERLAKLLKEDQERQAAELKAKQLAEQKAAELLAKQQKAEIEQQKKIAAQKEKELAAQQKQAELARQKAEAEELRLKKEQELAAQRQAEQERLAQEAKLKAEQALQMKLQQEAQEQARLAKLKAEAEQKEAQKQAQLAKEAALKAEQIKLKAIEQEKALQAQKLLAMQKAEAEAKNLAEKQAAEKLQAEQKAQAAAKALAEKQAAEKQQAEQKAQAAAKVLEEKQAAEKLQAEQTAKQQAELKAQAEAKLKAIEQEKALQAQKLAILKQQEELARQKAESDRILEEQRIAEEESKKAEAQRAYLAKVESDRIAAEEKAAKDAENLRIAQAAQEEQLRLEQLRKQELEAEKIAQEEAELARKQAEEQKIWVAYQQQVATQEGSRSSTSPVVSNSLNTAAKNYLAPKVAVVSSVPVSTAQVSEIKKIENTQSATMVSSSQSTDSGNVLVPNENGSIVIEGQGPGAGPLTKLEIETSSPMEVSWFKGLTPYNLYQRIVPSVPQLMPIQVNPANLVEGRIINQRALVNLSAAQPLTNSDSTNLEREIKLEIKATGTFESCSFSGVFSYLKCIAGTVTLMVKDLIHADKNLEIGSGNLVSNDLSISKYSISQVSQYLIPTSSTLPNQALYKGEMYFQAKLLENQSKLFKISGLNIFQVSNLNPGKDDAPWKLVVHNSELYFAALDQNGFAKLFKTNGNQITQLSNIFPQGNDYLTPAIVYNGELYLEGMNSDGFLKLFKTDGKTITQISDTNPSGSDAPSDFMVYNSELYFRSQNMSGLTKLFKLNGEGIFQVSDINHNQHDAPEFLQTYQGYLYFSAFLENVGNKLFRTNGEVVEQVLSINPGNDEPSDLLVYNNELYFVAVNKEGFRKLYKTNGLEAMQVSNIKVGGSDFALDYRNKKSYLTIYNNELYFVAKNPANGFKIFKTNGQGITQVSNINEISPELNPTGSDFPFNLMVYGNELYFSAYGNTAGLKLFKLSSESTRGLR